MLHCIPKGESPFDTLHVDHYVPVDKQHLLKRHVFLIVDAFTKFVRLYATKTTASREAIKCLSDYFASYSKPRVIISDCGTCFTSQEFGDFLNENNVRLILIATGSSQSNGQVERINRMLTPMLGKVTENDSGKYWYKVLPQIEYCINNTVVQATGNTPSRLLFGIDQRGQVDDQINEYLQEQVQNKSRDLEAMRHKAANKIVAAQEYNTRYFNERHKNPHQYQESDYIMLRNFDSTSAAPKKLLPAFKGLYVIKKVLRNDRYLVADIEGFQNTQRRYQGVWEAKNMRQWVKPTP